MGKKIAIIGTASNLVDAPYGNKEWEIWGLNGAYMTVPRWDRWFDLHHMDVLKKYHQPEYFEFLRVAGPKLMLNNKYEEFPEAQVFPAHDLVKKYGRYFTNTVAWLLALAIEEQPDEIGIWGVNMAADTEYGSQRPSCEYFIGLARGRGIKVTVPESSEMLKCGWLYGVEGIPAIIAKLPDKKREISCNLNEIYADIDNKQGFMNFINGYVTGTNDLADYLKEKCPEALNVTMDFLHEKHSKYKEEAIKTETELKELMSRKTYMDGAMGLMNYFYLNWSH